MDSTNRSKAWNFIAVSAVSLVVFIIANISLIGHDETASTSPIPLNVLLTFLFACIALGFGIAANASAYLSRDSDLPARIFSSLDIFFVLIIILPFLISLGLTMV